MVLKTYEAISDAFDFEIRKKNYINIVKKNAETYGDFKHNYIVEKLESHSNDIDIQKDLENEEKKLAILEEAKRRLPYIAIEKIVNINYGDISEKESELISYLQENTENNTQSDVLNFVCKMEQYFGKLLEDYKEIGKWKTINYEEEISYKLPPEIKENEFKSRDRSIKKGLWTLCNVIVNEAISYDLNTIAEVSGIDKELLKKFMTKDESVLEDKVLKEKLYGFIYIMNVKYKEYCDRYIWIAEGKEYDDSELGIKDFSNIKPPKEEIFEIERKIHRIQIEEIDEEHEKEIIKKQKKDQVEEPKKKKWINKIKDRFN